MFAAASPTLFTFSDFIPLAIFGLFAAIAWFGLEYMAASKPRAVERLDEIKNPQKRRSSQAEAILKKPDTVAMVLEKTSALTKAFAPRNAVEANKLKNTLASAGFRIEGLVPIFYGLKFAMLMAGFFLGGGMLLWAKGFSQNTLIWVVGVSAVCFWLPDMVLGFLARRRQQAIFLALPDVLDMMVVCVEAGLGLDQAMRKVGDEMKNAYPVLAAEFALTNFQLQMGRTRSECLHDLGQRTGVADLRSLAAVLIQADKFGSSVAQALRVQSESMRTRRRQLAEEKAAKTAVKLLFPLVLFIFPGIFVVLVGPAAITMVRQMFPKMH
ncbi:MAG: type II secretion system F family protein [Planctomycetota bacterium]